MDELQRGKSLRKALRGIKVERATAVLPATGTAAIFNIVGGRVAIRQLIGEVTVGIQVQLCNLTINGTPAVGTQVPLCTLLDVTGDEVGCLYGITGLNTDALIGINAGALPGQERDVVLNVGTMTLTTSATNTGSVRWTVLYVPIDDGAHVTAA